MKTAAQSLIVLALTAFTLPSTAMSAELVTVADLHAKRSELGGKQVTVTGQVVKVNNDIMKRNFIHMQDGTGSGKTGKVIFTSQETAKVGDEISATGTVKLDVDFGMGYFYPVLVEKAAFKPAK
ncbi:conserved exported protein of unknown function [Magnetospira sp. QH-2]|nr:conserved exported protein of unknown function [Magnetospira sp. QH-2]